MTTVLAFDTACDACSAAVWRDGEIVAREFVAMARGQSEALMPMIARAMAAARLEFADLAAVGVTVGPGAFTGLRIGLAAARAIALAAARPAIGVTTLEALAAAASDATDQAGALLVAIDAKRDDLYLQLFDGAIAAGEPIAALPEAATLPAGAFRLAGDGAARLYRALPDADRARALLLEEPRLPDAAVVARLAAARFAATAKEGGALAAPRPLYLRPPDAKLPHDGGRVRVKS